MPRFPIHDLSDTEFEHLVVLICRELMGIGITSFAPGPDGGKDAKFEGTATAFPSAAALASGKFIVQAKHTSSPVASRSDYDFESTLIDKEIPKIKRQFEEGRLTHYHTLREPGSLRAAARCQMRWQSQCQGHEDWISRSALDYSDPSARHLKRGRRMTAGQ